MTKRTDADWAEANKWDEVAKRLNGFALGDLDAARGWANAFFRSILALNMFDASHEARTEDLGESAFRWDRDPMKDRWDEQRVKELIRMADGGDRDAHRVVCEVIKWHFELLNVSTPRPLPLFLQKFLFELLDGTRVEPPPRRGWDPAANYARDDCILEVVTKLTKQGGFSRTRNPATDAPSASSIVAEVLSDLGVCISEKTVGQISKPRSLNGRSWLSQF